MVPLITSREYYDLNPSLENSPGDVWTQLPTMGLFPFPVVTGMIVTPACDLANRKVETVTYLPVVPVKVWFSTMAALPEIRRTITAQWKIYDQANQLLVWPDGFVLPTPAAIEEAQKRVTAAAAVANIGEKSRNALERVIAGLIIAHSLASRVAEINIKDLQVLFGDKVWKDTLEKITTNSYRSDIHFLPQDNQPNEWSGMTKHSVALLRYPITIPFEVLEAAQDIGLQDWNTFLESVEPLYPCAANLKGNRPMKRLRVKTPFISDLITRYTAINIRLGAPDFTGETVSRFCEEIQN